MNGESSNDKKKESIVKDANVAFLKTMLDSLVFGGLFINPARTIVYCNQHIEKIFGYSKNEIIGKQTDILYGDRRVNPRDPREIYNVLEKSGFHIGIAKGLTKHAKEVELKLSTFVIKPNSGAVIFIESVKQYKGAHIDMELFLQNLLDTIPDMIYFKDIKNRFVLVNKAHAAALGKVPQEVVGKSDLDFFPRELAVKYFEDDTNIIKTGKPVICKIEKAARPDGGMTYVSTTKVPHYDENGRIVGTIGITRNITDRMIAEEELREYKGHLESIVKERTRELEENNERLLRMYKIKTEFSSMVSHELRTPLTIIKEGIALVSDGVLGSLNEKQKANLGIVLSNIGRLTRLIDDILDFSKLENKKVEFRVTKGNLNGVIDQVVKSCETSVKKKGLLFKTLLDPALPLVEFDPDRIAQVLYNLINNAIKFTDKGFISICTSYDEQYVSVTVEDTGCGIRKEDLSRIFERFEQIYPEGEVKSGGTGLGLSICKQIIEQLKGQIYVESEYGRGSRFVFKLPIKT